MRAALRHSRLFRILLCLTAGIASAGWAAPSGVSPARTYPEYRVTVVGPANSYAADINKDGVIVGEVRFSDTYTRAFINRGNGLVYLDKQGATSDAVAINDKGQVLGNWKTRAGQLRGYIYYAGVRRDIGTVPGRNTRFTDINNAGFATALGLVPDSYEEPRSYLRTPNGTLTDIGSLPFTDPITYAYAINNSNKITGASGPLLFPDQPLRAMIWAKDVMRDLGDFGTSPNSGYAINDCGQVTGFASLFAGYRNRVAFLYSHGRMINIDGRPDTEERSSAGQGINNFGHVVGSSNHLSGFVYRGRRMKSLNALIDPKLHWDIADAHAINDAGQIAATGYRNGVQYAVRLDLIRPLLQRLSELERDDAQAAPAANTADQEEAKADAGMQARKVVHPVPQF